MRSLRLTHSNNVPYILHCVVKIGDVLDNGNGKQLVFVEMRMLNWQDSMGYPTVGNSILLSVAGWLGFAKQLGSETRRPRRFGAMAGFVVVDENIRAMRTHSDDNLGKIPALLT